MKKSLNKIPTDTRILFKTHDKIFENRQNFSKLLSINEIDNEKNNYKKLGDPLSLYDQVNIEAVSISPNAYLSPFRPTCTNFNFMEKPEGENENFNFNSFASSKNNFLMQRRTVSFNNKGFFNCENKNLTQKQKLTKSNFNFSHEAIKKAFLPPSEDKKYPKFFLPKAGSGLLLKPGEITDKNKKKQKQYKE